MRTFRCRRGHSIALAIVTNRCKLERTLHKQRYRLRHQLEHALRQSTTQLTSKYLPSQSQAAVRRLKKINAWLHCLTRQREPAHDRKSVPVIHGRRTHGSHHGFGIGVGGRISRQHVVACGAFSQTKSKAHCKDKHQGAGITA